MVTDGRGSKGKNIYKKVTNGSASKGDIFTEMVMDGSASKYNIFTEKGQGAEIGLGVPWQLQQ